MKTMFSSGGRRCLMIVSIFLIAVALIAWMVGCGGVSVPAIEIRTWYDLDAVRDLLTGSYTLMNDLDSSTAGYEELAGPNANGGAGWEPLGKFVQGELPFSGSFDGQGYEIRDLFINRPNESTDVGLFGALSMSVGTPVIKNVGGVNFTVVGMEQVGGLVGRLRFGTMSNCYCTGDITATGKVGGLVGRNYHGIVRTSYAGGSVTGNGSYVGGLVGSNGESAVINCYATGSVTGGSGVGGLVGWNAGNVSNCHATGSVAGGHCVGGLVGDDFGSVANCHATGNVTAFFYVGGLAGAAKNVTDSYATGKVTGSQQVGGLAGNAETVINCYATGNVTGDDAIGGLVGWHSDGTVSNSYATGSVVGNYSGGLVGVNGEVWLTTSDRLAVLIDNGSVAVRYSYSTGSVTGSHCVGGLVGQNYYGTVSDSYSSASATGTSRVGGLVGWNAGDVINSYAAGNVAGNNSVGGLVADNYGGTVWNSFWDIETSGQNTTAGGTGKTTAAMQDITTFSGAAWDIIGVANSSTRNVSCIWNIVDDETHPFLSWQPVS